MLRIPCFTGLPSIDGGYELRSFATIRDDFGNRCYKCSTQKAPCSTGAYRRHAPTDGDATKIFLVTNFRSKSVEPIVLPTRKGLKMATITKRNKTNGKPSFTAQVRIKKSGKVIFSKSETFSQRKLAEKWATRTEKAWHDGALSLVTPVGTFAELIKRYRLDIEQEVGKTMIQCLRTLEGMDETNVGCHEVGPTFLIDLARALKKEGRCAATVNNYMQHLYGLFTVAETAYKIPLQYVDMQSAMRTLRRLKIVGKANKRDRRPKLEELNDLMEEAFARSARSNAAPLHKIIAFAIASSRRLSEITRIRWDDLNYADKKVLVRDMKHPGQKKGNDVWALLSDEALQIIMSMPKVDDRIFPYKSGSLSTAFTRLVELFEDVEDLHFHDLRHEAISRAFEMGWSAAKVRMMSGHRSWSSLEIYTNLEKVGDQLEGWKWWDVAFQPETPERVDALKKRLAKRRAQKAAKKKKPTKK